MIAAILAALLVFVAAPAFGYSQYDYVEIWNEGYSFGPWTADSIGEEQLKVHDEQGSADGPWKWDHEWELTEGEYSITCDDGPDGSECAYVIDPNGTGGDVLVGWKMSRTCAADTVDPLCDDSAASMHFDLKVKRSCVSGANVGDPCDSDADCGGAVLSCNLPIWEGPIAAFWNDQFQGTGAAYDGEYLTFLYLRTVAAQFGIPASATLSLYYEIPPDPALGICLGGTHNGTPCGNDFMCPVEPEGVVRCDDAPITSVSIQPNNWFDVWMAHDTAPEPSAVGLRHSALSVGDTYNARSWPYGVCEKSQRMNGAACGAPGECFTCIGGQDQGVNCVDDSDCDGAGAYCENRSRRCDNDPTIICAADVDCGGGTCLADPGTTCIDIWRCNRNSGHCENDPTQLCALDEDCVESGAGGACVQEPGLGGPGDFKTTHDQCSDAGRVVYGANPDRAAIFMRDGPGQEPIIYVDQVAGWNAIRLGGRKMRVESLQPVSALADTVLLLQDCDDQVECLQSNDGSRRICSGGVNACSTVATGATGATDKKVWPVFDAPAFDPARSVTDPNDGTVYTEFVDPGAAVSVVIRGSDQSTNNNTRIWNTGLAECTSGDAPTCTTILTNLATFKHIDANWYRWGTSGNNCDERGSVDQGSIRLCSSSDTGRILPVLSTARARDGNLWCDSDGDGLCSAAEIVDLTRLTDVALEVIFGDDVNFNSSKTQRSAMMRLQVEIDAPLEIPDRHVEDASGDGTIHMTLLGDSRVDDNIGIHEPLADGFIGAGGDKYSKCAQGGFQSETFGNSMVNIIATGGRNFPICQDYAGSPAGRLEVDYVLMTAHVGNDMPARGGQSEGDGFCGYGTSRGGQVCKAELSTGSDRYCVEGDRANLGCSPAYGYEDGGGNLLCGRNSRHARTCGNAGETAADDGVLCWTDADCVGAPGGAVCLDAPIGAFNQPNQNHTQPHSCDAVDPDSLGNCYQADGVSGSGAPCQCSNIAGPGGTDQCDDYCTTAGEWCFKNPAARATSCYHGILDPECPDTSGNTSGDGACFTNKAAGTFYAFWEDPYVDKVLTGGVCTGGSEPFGWCQDRDGLGGGTPCTDNTPCAGIGRGQCIANTCYTDLPCEAGGTCDVTGTIPIWGFETKAGTLATCADNPRNLALPCWAQPDETFSNMTITKGMLAIAHIKEQRWPYVDWQCELERRCQGATGKDYETCLVDCVHYRQPGTTVGVNGFEHPLGGMQVLTDMMDRFWRWENPVGECYDARGIKRPVPNNCMEGRHCFSFEGDGTVDTAKGWPESEGGWTAATGVVFNDTGTPRADGAQRMLIGGAGGNINARYGDSRSIGDRRYQYLDLCYGFEAINTGGATTWQFFHGLPRVEAIGNLLVGAVQIRDDSAAMRAGCGNLVATPGTEFAAAHAVDESYRLILRNDNKHQRWEMWSSAGPSGGDMTNAPDSVCYAPAGYARDAFVNGFTFATAGGWSNTNTMWVDGWSAWSSNDNGYRPPRYRPECGPQDPGT